MQTAEDALVHILPVPFDATASYRLGACDGAKAIYDASFQVDLADADVGEPHLAGIFMEPISEDFINRNSEARECTTRVREALEKGETPAHEDVDKVNDLTQKNNEIIYEWTRNVLRSSKIPVILGGDHSVPLGAIGACAKAKTDGIGVLHIDAHCDLRREYQGFWDSHASIMNNVMRYIPEVKQLVQVGIRDFCNEELEEIENSNGRIVTYFDSQLRRSRMTGHFIETAKCIIEHLPEHVYVSFDIDGLDPVLCPGTGTPVPGGLSFDEMVVLLQALATSGRRIVGMDLVEVASQEWDSIVGARVLYKMIGFALMSQNHPAAEPLMLPPVPGV